MEEINNLEKDREQNQQENISSNLIKRTTIIKNSKPIKITSTPTPPSIPFTNITNNNDNIFNNEDINSTTTNNITDINNTINDESNNGSPILQNNELETPPIYHKNEFFVISDIVPIECSSPLPIHSISTDQLNTSTNINNNNSRLLNIPNTTIATNSNNNNTNKRNDNNSSPGQLIEIPLSPINLRKERDNTQEDPEPSKTTTTTTTTTSTFKKKGSVVINHMDELPIGSELKEHNVLTKSGFVNIKDTSSSPYDSPLSVSKPFIPPPSTQLFPKGVDGLTKKELKKEKKIERHILEAIHDINNNEIVGELSTTTATPMPPSPNINSSTNSPKVGKTKYQQHPINPNIGSNSVGKTKKKKRKNKKKKHLEHKKNSLGETIYKGQQSWLLMRTIQTGILNCISKTSHRNIREDSDEFFQSLHYCLPVIEEHPNMTFKFKDYCPHAFSRLRDLFNIDSISYVHSICKPWNEVVTPGKSGSIFFFTHDNQYVLKTIPKREAKLLRSLLPEYYEHMKRNPNSLLTKFFGLHRVKPQNGRQVRFLVMKNLFCTPKEITQRFDLKGSTVGRELSAEELKKTCPTFKDLDFRRLGKKIHLGPDRKKLFIHQLSEDCKFLVKLNIMDYSLLIGLHNKDDLLKRNPLIPPQTQQPNNNTNNYNNSNNNNDQFESGDNYSTGDDTDTEEYYTSDDDPNNSKNDLRVSKKISSIKETKNYLHHFGTNNPNNTTGSQQTYSSTTTTTTTTTHPHPQINQQPLQQSSSQYMKPVDHPVLPPVLPESELSPHPYIKPKISIFEHDKGGMQGINERNEAMGEYYFMGIIDILMLYSFRKQIEHTYKSIFSKGEVSSVDPVEYAARFINFISDVIV
ncbi:hypothetical protein RB653_005342 [Dictyostelium firmibasis]|uniref:PIPK domain-containing protein n=1 Tax=Dictyostelium firmibasis TaxID=79012 RepID=A0AAN7UKV3_9MYCE